MFTIEFILPYQKLRTSVENVFKDYPHRDQIDFIVTAKNHYEIREGELKGDVLISRGLTAEYLDRMFTGSFFVIELAMSSYDIMKAVHDGLGKYPGAKTVGLVATPQTIYSFEDYIQESNIDIRTYPIDINEGYAPAVQKAMEDKMDFLIGGDGAVSYALSLGYPSIRIDAGRESVRQAIDDAWYVYQSRKEQELRNSRLDAVIEGIDEGVLSCDVDKRVTVCNSYAQGILGKPLSEILGQPIDSLVPQGALSPFGELKEREHGKYCTINGSSVMVSRTPILVDDAFASGVMVLQKASRIQSMEREIRSIGSKTGLVANHTFKQILGQSRAINNAKELALNFSKVNANVLLLGDTGTGKELFAQSIHNASSRHNKPFVAVNCAALPESILESELFGYVSGAFTGASRNGKVGLFEMAHTGTIFLDEISEMSLPLQGRLLRVLEEREIMRLGSDKVTPIDVRIIAASNRDIEKLVEENKFRKDLLYRLDVLHLELPSLAERWEDIPELMESFIEHFDRKSGLVKHMLDPEIFPCLQSYNWPGNVRQLRNLCERLSAIVFDSIIKLEDLKRCFSVDRVTAKGPDLDEKSSILKALSDAMGNKSVAAEKLGIDRSTLYRKMRKYSMLQ